MPADRLLTTVLGAFRGATDPTQTNRILSSTQSLLTTLSNPLNITLLTSQLLQSPAIWNQADDLELCFRIISIFNTAAIVVHKNQREGPAKPYDAYQPRHGGGLHCNDWATAVIEGADERSARWQHVLVIAGVLFGMESNGRHGMSRGLRDTFESAMVMAVNLSVENPAFTGALGVEAVVLGLNHTFPLLSNSVTGDLNYDSLMMVMVQAMTSREGYQDGSFLDPITSDVRQVGSLLDWPKNSSSFLELRKMASRPLVASMGPLSRLIAHSIENARSPARVIETREHLLAFTGRILGAWRLTSLSEIDFSEESKALTEETMRFTVPALWQILKTAMFATVVILRSVIQRTLLDPILSRGAAPVTASHAILILRNIHFISSRLGSNTFSAYSFVNLTSIDILSRHPQLARDLLRKIYPEDVGQIPSQPLKRNLDLFYLNTCEHFTLSLTDADNETLVVTPASPYLNPIAHANLRDIFEAAHSAMLAVLAAPQAAGLSSGLIPFYVESLFKSFPNNLSPRQFRFAFKTLIQITTPPAPLSQSHPMLSEILLEMLHYRVHHAHATPLMPFTANVDAGGSPDPLLLLSEQAVLLMTLLDALPNLPISLLKDWLPLAAGLLGVIEDAYMRERCRARFWEVLESGEMDVERSAVCVTWWSTRGGRNMVLFGDAERGPFMSGALVAKDGSRL